MKTYVVIPTYNEAKTIGWLVRKIKETAVKDVVVVDDGSIDATYKIARENGAVVLRNERNLGKGTSLKTGFDYCLAKNCNAVITMDGDGQHSPEEIPRLIDFAESSKADIVVGNRMHHPQGMPYLRFLTNKFMSVVISSLLDQSIPDTQCGLRLLKKEVLKNIRLKSANFEIESEILVQAVRKGFAVQSLPIKAIYHPDIESQINPVIDTLRFFKFIMKTVMRW